MSLAEGAHSFVYHEKLKMKKLTVRIHIMVATETVHKGIVTWKHDIIHNQKPLVVIGEPKLQLAVSHNCVDAQDGYGHSWKDCKRLIRVGTGNDFLNE